MTSAHAIASLSRSILVVDDDDRFRDRLVASLAARGHDVRGAASLDEAKAVASADSPEWAVVDLRLPAGSGLDVIDALRAIDETTRIVVLTGYGSIATALDAVRRGASDYLTKPADAVQILAAFEGTPRREEHDTSEAPSLARVEWEHIQRVLVDCNHNISQAARVLGLHRRSLQRKLAKFPVRR